jgi:hypothetical protein
MGQRMFSWVVIAIGKAEQKQTYKKEMIPKAFVG